MAAGTVGYTDTRGNRDYIGEIAGQIKRRVGEASDMAGKERAFAEEQAEAGGTSLSEAGIGRGYFFGRALGSRFGGDAIARTKGRFTKTPSAGTDPAGTAASRFRGGFDYNVTNEISTAGVAPLTGAVVSGLSGVETGLVAVSQSMMRIDNTLGGLERTQADMARAMMGLGYMMAMLRSQSQRAAGRESLRREERSIEGRGSGGGSIGGSSFGGAGGGRGMINVTPGGGSGGSGGGGGFGFGKGYSAAGDDRGSGSGVMSALTSGLGIKGISKGAKGYATASMLKKGKGLGATSLAVRGASAGQLSRGFGGAFDASKVSTSLMRVLGDEGKGLGGIFKGIIGRVFDGSGVQSTKIGMETLENSMVTGKMLQKSGLKVNASQAEALATNMNLIGSQVKEEFAAELNDIITRSKRYAKFAGLHGNTKLAQSDVGFQYRQNLVRDRKTFQSMRYNKKRMFNDDMIEQFLRLGISPGAANVEAFGRGGMENSLKYMDAAATNVDESLRIAEDLNEFFPKGLHKFKSGEDAVILTKYARELDSIKKLADPTRAEVNLAKKNIENLFGKTRVDKALKESGAAMLTNTTLKKSMKKMGAGRLAKLIPGISAIMGTYFAIDRARKGDFFGAGLELTSGLAGIVPGIGTKAGLGIDAYLLARDFGLMPLNTGTPLVGLEGTLRNGKTGTDTNHALLSNGESVLNQKATAQLGPGNIAALNLLGVGGLGAGIVMGMLDKRKDYTDLQGEGFVKGMNKLSGARSASLVNFDFSRNDSSQNMSQNIDQAFITKLTDTLSGIGTEGSVINNITNNNITAPQGQASDDSGPSSGGFSDGGLDFARIRYLSGLM